MSIVRQTPDDLLRAVELTHENYIRSLRSYHEALAGRGSFGTPPLRPSINPLSHEISSTSAPTAALALARPRRGTNDRLQAPSSLNSFSMAADEAPMPYHDADLMSFIPLLEPMARSNSESGASSASQHAAAAQKTLEQISYSDDSFVSYLKDAEIDDSAHSGTYMALEHVLARRPDIDGTAELASLLPTIEQDYVTSTCEVYEVDRDSTVNRIEPDLESSHTRIAHGDQASQIVDSLTVWRTIKNINQSGNSVGRITILQEPTALMLAALRMTMSTHFDMDEIYQHLVTDVDNRGRTRALVATRPFARVPTTARPPVAKPPHSEHIRPPLIPGHDADDSLHLRQRSFLFVFKYYTVVAEGLEPAPWQKFDKRPVNRRGADHIDIAECSSVLALSLGGAPVRSVTLKQRRTQGEGLLFDTFAPWHLLSIQAFPDDEHTVREPSATAGATAARKTFCNGPEAFLDALVLEYRDATKRNHILHDRITELITPEILFMFNSALRDKLLFEDKHFTYIRRYFWAYNTLGVINNSIRAMRAGYEQTFTPDFWEGRHTTLWPHPAGPDSAEGRAYRDRLAVLRADLEAAMRDLDRVEKRNEHTRKEIDDLRNQLFSGSSIFESRRAIEQGDFIRILTLGTIIFLPLTFVTSVFGITSYDVPLTDWRFAVMVTCISVPFVILLIVLSSHTGYTQFKNFVHWVKRQLKAVLLATYTWAQQRRGRSRGSKGDAAGAKATPRAAVGRGSASDGERRRPRRKKQLTVKRQDSSTGNRSWYFWREKRVRIEVDMEKKG